MRRILIEAIVILTLGVVVGLTANFSPLLKLLRGESLAPPPQAVAPAGGGEEAGSSFPQPAGLDQVRQLVAEGGLLVDARIEELYAEGHLAGSASLPLASYEEHIDAFRAEVAPGRPLIVYCSGYGCPDSFDLALRLLEEGYREVYVFEGGFPEAAEAGWPVKGEQP